MNFFVQSIVSIATYNLQKRNNTFFFFFLSKLVLNYSYFIFLMENRETRVFYEDNKHFTVDHSGNASRWLQRECSTIYYIILYYVPIYVYSFSRGTTRDTDFRSINHDRKCLRAYIHIIIIIAIGGGGEVKLSVCRQRLRKHCCDGERVIAREESDGSKRRRHWPVVRTI